jgi:hypothetical protein
MNDRWLLCVVTVGITQKPKLMANAQIVVWKPLRAKLNQAVTTHQLNVPLVIGNHATGAVNMQLTMNNAYDSVAKQIWSYHEYIGVCTDVRLKFGNRVIQLEIENGFKFLNLSEENVHNFEFR